MPVRKWRLYDIYKLFILRRFSNERFFPCEKFCNSKLSLVKLSHIESKFMNLDFVSLHIERGSISWPQDRGLSPIPRAGTLVIFFKKEDDKGSAKGEQKECLVSLGSKETIKEGSPEERTLRGSSLTDRDTLLSVFFSLPFTPSLCFSFTGLWHGSGVVFITIFGVFIDYSFMFPVHNWKSRWVKHFMLLMKKNIKPNRVAFYISVVFSWLFCGWVVFKDSYLPPPPSLYDSLW